MFRTQILPAIVALWGAAIVIHTLTAGTDGGAYGAGQLTAAVVGVIMVTLGCRALLKARTT